MCSRGPWRRQPGTVVSNRSTAILIKTHTVAREDVTAAVETRGQHRLLEINAQPITEQLQTSLGLKRKFFVPQMKHRVRRLPERPFELGIDTPPARHRGGPPLAAAALSPASAFDRAGEATRAGDPRQDTPPLWRHRCNVAQTDGNRATDWAHDARPPALASPEFALLRPGR